MIWSRETIYIDCISAYLMYREDNGTTVYGHEVLSVCTLFLTCDMYDCWSCMCKHRAICDGSSEWRYFQQSYVIKYSGLFGKLRDLGQTLISICNYKSQKDNDTMISGFIIVSLALECSLWYYWNYIYGYLLQDASILLVIGHIVNFIVYVVVVMLKFSKL